MKKLKLPLLLIIASSMLVLLQACSRTQQSVWEKIKNTQFSIENDSIEGFRDDPRFTFYSLAGKYCFAIVPDNIEVATDVMTYKYLGTLKSFIQEGERFSYNFQLSVTGGDNGQYIVRDIGEAKISGTVPKVESDPITELTAELPVLTRRGGVLAIDKTKTINFKSSLVRVSKGRRIFDAIATNLKKINSVRGQFFFENEKPSTASLTDLFGPGKSYGVITPVDGEDYGQLVLRRNGISGSVASKSGIEMTFNDATDIVVKSSPEKLASIYEPIPQEQLKQLYERLHPSPQAILEKEESLRKEYTGVWLCTSGQFRGALALSNGGGYTLKFDGGKTTITGRWYVYNQIYLKSVGAPDSMFSTSIVGQLHLMDDNLKAEYRRIR